MRATRGFVLAAATLLAAAQGSRAGVIIDAEHFGFAPLGSPTLDVPDGGFAGPAFPVLSLSIHEGDPPGPGFYRFDFDVFEVGGAMPEFVLHSGGSPNDRFVPPDGSPSNIAFVVDIPQIELNQLAEGGRTSLTFEVRNIVADASLVTPEPATLVGAGIGLAGLGLARLRRRARTGTSARSGCRCCRSGSAS